MGRVMSCPVLSVRKTKDWCVHCVKAYMTYETDQCQVRQGKTEMKMRDHGTCSWEKQKELAGKRVTMASRECRNVHKSGWKAQCAPGSDLL